MTRKLTRTFPLLLSAMRQPTALELPTTSTRTRSVPENNTERPDLSAPPPPHFFSSVVVKDTWLSLILQRPWFFFLSRRGRASEELGHVRNFDGDNVEDREVHKLQVADSNTVVTWCVAVVSSLFSVLVAVFRSVPYTGTMIGRSGEKEGIRAVLGDDGR